MGNVLFGRFVALGLGLVLTACASVKPPEGQEDTRTFIQQSAAPYQDAYRVIAKQFRACYRVIGLFGNGYDVQADLDTVGKKGSVEVYYVGLTGAQKPEDSRFSRTVTISESANGSTIQTTGTTPGVVYMTHRAIESWLAGIDSCAARAN